MGEPKLLLPWNKTTILRTVVETAMQTPDTRTTVVINPAIRRLAAELDDVPINVVLNDRADEGMSTSLQAGVAAMDDDVEAVMILLADQPMMTQAIISQVIAHYRQASAPITQASFKGKPSHPVLFDRSLFPELLATTGDQGARTIINKYHHKRQLVHFDVPPLEDIDTKEDYIRLVQTNSG